MIMFFIIVVCSAILFYILRDKDEARIKKAKKQEIKARKLAAKQAAKGVINE